MLLFLMFLRMLDLRRGKELSLMTLITMAQKFLGTLNLRRGKELCLMTLA